MSGFDNVHGQYKQLLRKFDKGTITAKEEKKLAKLETILGTGQTFGPASHVRHYSSLEATEPYKITEIDFATGRPIPANG